MLLISINLVILSAYFSEAINCACECHKIVFVNTRKFFAQIHKYFNLTVSFKFNPKKIKSAQCVNNVICGGFGSTSGHDLYMGTQNLRRQTSSFVLMFDNYLECLHGCNNSNLRNYSYHVSQSLLYSLQILALMTLYDF